MIMGSFGSCDAMFVVRLLFRGMNLFVRAGSLLKRLVLYDCFWG